MPDVKVNLHAATMGGGLWEAGHCPEFSRSLTRSNGLYESPMCGILVQRPCVAGEVRPSLLRWALRHDWLTRTARHGVFKRGLTRRAGRSVYRARTAIYHRNDFDRTRAFVQSVVYTISSEWGNAFRRVWSCRRGSGWAGGVLVISYRGA